MSVDMFRLPPRVASEHYIVDLIKMSLLFACSKREIDSSDWSDNHKGDVVPLRKDGRLVCTDLCYQFSVRLSPTPSV